MRKRNILMALLIMIGLLLAACGSDSSAPAEEEKNTGNSNENAQEEVDPNAPQPLKETAKIKIGYPTQGASMLPLWVAEDAGIFDKYGIDAELIYIAGTPKVQETLNGGSIDVGLSVPESVGKSKVAGIDTVILSAIADRIAVYVYGQKDADPSNVAEELKGKTLITAAEGSLYDHLAQFFIRENGLTPNEDVKLLHMGGEGDRTAAFLKGDGDFYVVAPPTSFKMDDMGHPQVYDFIEKEVLLSGLTMKRDYYEENPELAKALVASLIEANAYIANNKEEAIESVMKWTGIDDPELAKKTYEVTIDTIPQKPFVSDESVQFFLDNSDSEEVNNMQPADLVDDSIVKELDESGWIDSLY